MGFKYLDLVKVVARPKDSVIILTKDPDQVELFEGCTGKVTGKKGASYTVLFDSPKSIEPILADFVVDNLVLIAQHAGDATSP